MNPITGPYYSQYGIDEASNRSYRHEVWRYRQVKPYDLASPYRARHQVIEIARAINGQYRELTYLGQIPAYANAWTGSNRESERGAPYGWEHPTRLAALAKARKKFISKMGDTANLALALLERKQTMDLLTSRLTQLAQFSKAISQGKFNNAIYILDPHYRRGASKAKTRTKELANGWLEYWFGISPLVKDIATAIDILDGPVKDQPVLGRAKIVEHWFDNSVINDGTTTEQVQTEHRLTVRGRVQAMVKVDNPNLFLANQLGLTNPAFLAYEAVKFSFIANWFFNIEEWLSSWNEFHGLTIIDPCHSTTYEHYAYTTSRKLRNDVGSSMSPWGYDIGGRTLETERRLGIPEVTLGLRYPWQLSATRALTASSLLTQRFISDGGVSRPKPRLI